MRESPPDYLRQLSAGNRDIAALLPPDVGSLSLIYASRWIVSAAQEARFIHFPSATRIHC